MKKTLAFIILVALCIPCFAGQYSSIPVDHEVYRIIDWASLKGIIPIQSDVKPYNLDKILRLLDTIYSSDLISASQRNQIDIIRDEFEQTNGTKESVSYKDIVANGFYRKSISPVSVKVGAKAYSTQTFGIASNDSDMVWDSRNGLTAYVTGDVYDAASIDLNFSLILDKLAPTAFLGTDFKMDSDGFYQFLTGSLTNVDKKNNVFFGYFSVPEVSTTTLKDTLTARYASIDRDWGIGHNNIQLSSTAGTINGVDLAWQPTSWFSYSVLLGSLGKMSLGTDGTLANKTSNLVYTRSAVGSAYVLFPSDVLHEDYYDNNISAHKAEVTFFNCFKVSMWETLVYRSRFELSYLNPLTIYMYEQNKNGDFDNVLAGFDFAFNYKNIGTAYLSFVMDEANNFTKLFSDPRNIFAYQAGLKFGINDGGFGRVTLQATYVPAFFGSHYGYATDANPWGKAGYKTTYVNAGRLLGYPVNPDTLELLADYETTINSDVNVYALGRIQLRSAQYATHAGGTNILDTIDYGTQAAGGYSDRDFFHNLWDQIFSLDLNVEKAIDDYPISLTCNLQMILERSRSYQPITTDAYDYTVHNTGKVTWTSDWKTAFSMNASFGVKIYY